MLKWAKQRQTEIEILPKFNIHNNLNNQQDKQEKIMSSSGNSFGTKMERFFRRKSLGHKSVNFMRDENKENIGNYFSPVHSFRRSLTPLQDLSNGQSPKMINSTEKRVRDNHLMLTRKNSCTVITNNNSFDSLAVNISTSDKLQFSDDFVNQSQSFKTLNSHTKHEEESFSSSRIGDTTLDKMIDAIIESARKEEKCTKRVRHQSDSFEDFYEPSIHEMEVKTPPTHHLKRQKVVRRKNKSEPPSKHKNMNRIGLTLPNGIPSPETPISRFPNTTKTYDELTKMDTPQGICFVVDSLPNTSRRLSNCGNGDNQKCSTPTMEMENKTNAVKRCLSFSPNSDDDYSQLRNFKRDSVASSTTSSSSSLLAANRTICRTASIKGSVDITIFEENGNLNVHVIRCRGLERPNGSSDVNAYVKVALLPPDDENDNHSNFKRTAVHRNSSRPYFDHKFKFDIRNEKNLMKRVQLAVWHRDRELKRSEFLGCMSFPVKSVLKTGVNGSYKLQSQECLTNPLPPVPLNTLVNQYLNNFSLQHQSSSLSSSSSISTNTIATVITNNNDSKSCINTESNCEIDMATTADRRQQSVEEDVISIDSASAAAQHLIDANTGQPIALSKKAIHQRDADENLFLRFLELDPPHEQAGPRRMSTFKPAMGRTPFTITKKLTRTAEKGYGFSIVWTHPPRVEKVEPGMSADRAGIHPGDYVIFVDKHNIVTMPEADVLNLIRSQGNTLTLEIFRRSSSTSIPSLNASRSAIINGVTKSRVASAASNYTYEEMSPALKQSVGLGQRSSTACSNTSIETTKRRLNLPQVTFSKESIAPVHGVEDHRRRLLLQLVSREQNYVNALHFGMQRFVQPLNERKDLISPNDHRTLFQNIDELVRISEDILEQLTQDDHEPQLNFASRVYLSKTTAICAAYKKYCNGIKRADCVLVNKSRQPGSEFVSFITEPQVPRKRPDLTMFIHRPLQHFREILKLMQLLASHCHVDSEEHRNFTSVINELQAAYREITVGGGLMEPLGEGRPLLTLQDLESRMVFTRCKPFTLAVQGRQWIFGGDLSRVEGRSIKPYWTLLFSDIIVFAKVSRDRVLFITEEPLPIGNIVDSCFNIRKKTTEFRITVDPNGRLAESPTGYCAPDLTTPKKNMRRKTLILRAPSLELKAVWQNLLQRQIFLVNAALGSTPLSSPLDSPDVLNTLVPLSDIGATTASMASMKISSMDSINLKNQQNRQINPAQHLEQLIDEKCRILNKTGTPKGSALHLANWMKGQLDKQQEQARLAAAQSKERLDREDAHLLESNEYDDERITYWTREQLEKRTKELNLAKENGNVKPLHDNFAGRRLSGVEEVGISDVESDIKSPSRSTTSDSQITVRSSPNANIVDKLSVCRHCHKNCKQKMSPSPPLLNYSLKVQHSQSSPNRCCQLNSAFNTAESNASAVGTISNSASIDESCDQTISSTSSTITEEQRNRIEYTAITKESNQNLEQTPVSTISIPSTPASTSRLLNGTWSESESSDQDSKDTNKTTTTPSVSPITTTTTITTSSPQKPTKLHTKKVISHIPCNCKCTPEDFSNTTLSPDELKQETCKIIDDVTQLTNSQHETTSIAVCSPHVIDNDPHKNCVCVCKNKQENQNSHETKSEDELSLVLIGLAQFNPAAKLVHSDAFVPTISVVPPTPEPILSKTMTNIWDNTTCTATKLTINNIPGQAIIENIPEDSPDESPQDEEPPYRALNTKLRRYGTMSSLEKLAVDDTRNIGGGEHSSEEGEEEDDEDEDEVDGEEEDDDIEVITRQVFTGDENNQASLRNWTARAGSYVAEKMSFFEESRAFIDKYLGRWNQEQAELDRAYVGDEEQMEECTSGATSGEEVWGTPTSGGDNEDMQIGSSEHTQSSPTKSNSSLNDDDDTELMMDELLMAPPMTASTIRGLLPRRRLEPLFEEETESDEEREHQESSELATKGETSTNGHDLDISIGRLRNDGLNHIIRPIISHGQLLKTTSITSIETETKFDFVPKVTAVSTMIRTTSIDAINSNDTNSNINNNLMKGTGVATISTTMTSSSLITSDAVATSSMNTSTTTITTTMTNTVRRAKFSPPPPPPRRLLLTQTDSKATNTQHKTEIQRMQDSKTEQFGNTADIGSSVDALNTAQPTHKVNDQKVVSNMKSYVESTDPVEDRQSKTTDKLMSSMKTVSSITTTVNTSTTSTPSSHEIQSSTEVTETTEAAERTITENQSQSPSQKAVVPGSGLSPRLEMRLALNHDILGDEDLINYDPGPDLTTILGHDLSTFHRLTGRDLLNRSANRIQPKEAVISYSQQRNSKMDTPTLNRKRHQQHHLQQQLQQNRNILNSSAFVDRIGGNDISADSCKSSNNSSEGSKLSDLEILARREKMYCMSQLKSGSPARKAITMTTTTTTTTASSKVMMRSTSSTALDPENRNQAGIKGDSKTNRIFNFLTRRNSENQLTKIISRDSLTESNASSTPTPDRRILSPRKDNDKPSLNRRFWKQLTKRRRANSVSEIIAS